jgi:hypothetical protein
MHRPLAEAVEVKQAMAKAEEYAHLASAAKTDEDREYYERLHRKWLGLADGWRFISEIDSRGGRI